MGNVISLDAARKARHSEPEVRLPDPGFRRSAELILILEIVKTLPKAQRSKALMQVMMLGERFPECAVAKDAGYLAALMTQWGESSRG